MKRYIFGDVTLELTKGNITRQNDLQAIANAANAKLVVGGGVDGAIHRIAGPGLFKEAHPLGPLSPGQAVITSGHNLPNEHVIHCLGPVYGVDKPHDKLLADCYRNALEICEKDKIKSIGFPAISTGVFGYPMQEAAMVAIKTIIDLMPSLKYVKLIRLVLFDDNSLDIHSSCLDKLI
jgi:O-acetyl-ADP-ribose deacetylase